MWKESEQGVYLACESSGVTRSVDVKWERIETVGKVELAELAGSEAVGSAWWELCRTESMVPPRHRTIRCRRTWCRGGLRHPLVVHGVAVVAVRWMRRTKSGASAWTSRRA